MKCGQFIIRKISKIVATICQILRLNAPKSISARGFAPDTLGSLQCSPDPLAATKRTYF